MFDSANGRRMLAAALAATVAYCAPALAQEGSGSGEVRRIDAAAGKITIKHGAISDLALPAITLVYQIDPALLAGLQPGDQVKFTARRVDGHYVVVKISK